MTRGGATPGGPARSLRSRWGHPEAGSTVVEATLLIPVAMLLILFAVQACLWVRAGTLVAEAAQRGQLAANLDGGSIQVGIDTARAALLHGADGAVEDVSVEGVFAPGDIGEVRVTARSEAIIPGLGLAVSAVGVGPRQEFRVSG